METLDKYFNLIIGILIMLVCMSLTDRSKSSKAVEPVTLKSHAEYVLGDDNHSGFKVTLKNTSTQTLDILCVDKRERKVNNGYMIGPQGQMSISIKKDEKFILQNHSQKKVSVFIQIKKPAGRFRYQLMRYYEH